MAYSEPLAERIRCGFARRRKVDEKKMFGGIGFLLNVLVAPPGLEDDQLAEWIQRAVKFVGKLPAG